MRWRTFLLLCALVISLWPAPAVAQTVTGTVQGTVKDAGGGILPGVAVVARSAETGATRETVTNEVGFFVLPFLPLGGYDVSAALAGFKTVVREAIPVTLNATRVVDFELAPAAIAETVIVRCRDTADQHHQRRDQRLAERAGNRRTGRRSIRAAFSRSRRRSPGSARTRRPGRTTRPLRPARRSISTAPARAARRFRSTASTTTIPPRTRTGRARRSRPSRSSRSSPTPTPRSSAAATGPSSWYRPSPAPIRSTGICMTSTRTARGMPRARSPRRSRTTRAISTAPPPVSPSGRTASSLRQRGQEAIRGLPDLHARSVPGERAGRAAPDPGQRHAGEPRVHRERPVSLSQRRAERPAEPEDLPDPASHQSASRRPFAAARLDAERHSHGDRTLPMDASDLRVG